MRFFTSSSIVVYKTEKKENIKAEEAEEPFGALEALQALENAEIDEDLASQQEENEAIGNALDNLLVGQDDYVPSTTTGEVESASSEMYYPFGEMVFSETSGSLYNPEGNQPGKVLFEIFSIFSPSFSFCLLFACPPKYSKSI